MQTVVETPTFRKAAKEAELSEEEIEAIVNAVAENPQAGDILEGTGGARKLRIAGRGKGKSGGFRIVTYFAGEDVPVFLLDLYSKGQKVNLTKAERNSLQAILSGIAAAYRQKIATLR